MAYPTLGYCGYTCLESFNGQICSCETLVHPSFSTQSFQQQEFNTPRNIDPSLPQYSTIQINTLGQNDYAALCPNPWDQSHRADPPTRPYADSNAVNGNYNVQPATQDAQYEEQYYGVSVQEPTEHSGEYIGTEDRYFGRGHGSISQTQMSGPHSLTMGNMGTQFPSQEQARPARLMDGRDLEISSSTTHRDEFLQVPIRLPDDHLSLGDLGRRHSRDITATPGSTRTSYSDPDGSVLGGRFPCRKPWCSKSYKTKNGEKRHAKSHEQGYQKTRRFKCLLCEASFFYPKDLTRHHRSAHNLNRPFKCQFEGCEYYTKGFKRNDHLTRHHLQQHNFTEMEAASL